MVNVRLYINGELADLKPKTVVALTLQVNNIAELVDRQASYTNKIALPKTKQNNRIFGNTNTLQVSSTIPYTKLNVQLIQDGVEVVNGIGVLDSITPTDYQFVIYSNAVDFFTIIKERELNDLDLSAYYHDRADYLNYITTTDGWVYPVIDYGLLPDSGSTIDSDYLYPAFYLHTLIKEIIEQAGFTYTGDVFTDVGFLSEVIPFTNDELDVLKVILEGTQSTFETGVINYSVPLTATTAVPPFDFGSQVINNGITFNGTFFDNFPIARTRFIYDITITNTTSNDIGFELLEGIAPPFVNPVAFGQEYVIEAGATVTLNVKQTTPLGTGNAVRVYMLASATGLVVSNVSTSVGTAKDWVINSLPKIKQSDLIKFCMQSYCLTPITSKYGNQIEFNSFNELEANKPNAYDWSGKFETNSHSIRTAWTYAQNNYFRWANDESVVYDGTGVITSNNENLPKNKDVIVSKFAASDMVVKLDGISMASIEKYDGTSFTNKVTIRLLRVYQISKALTLGATPVTEIMVSYFVEQGRDGLDWTEIIARNYSSIENVLTDTKVINCQVLLTSDEVSSFDFTRPVYIDYFGSYFYVNKITNFVPNRLTSVELIRI